MCLLCCLKDGVFVKASRVRDVYNMKTQDRLTAGGFGSRGDTLLGRQSRHVTPPAEGVVHKRRLKRGEKE